MFRCGFLLFSLAISGYSRAETPTTHCTSDEKPVFNCQIKNSNKVASVCEGSSLHYRFGRIGNPEFVFPSADSGSNDQENFRYSASRSRDYDRYEYVLEFAHEGYAYVVYYGEKSGKSYESSITVWKLKAPCTQNCGPRSPYAAPEGKQIKVIACTNKDAGAELYRLNNRYRPMPPVDLPTPCLVCDE